MKRKFWFAVHNLIAHPLLCTGKKWADRFHDWTAKKMDLVMKKKTITRYFIVLSFIGDQPNSYHPDAFHNRTEAKQTWKKLYKGQVPFYCLKEKTSWEIT